MIYCFLSFKKKKKKSLHSLSTADKIWKEFFFFVGFSLQFYNWIRVELAFFINYVKTWLTQNHKRTVRDIKKGKEKKEEITWCEFHVTLFIIVHNIQTGPLYYFPHSYCLLGLKGGDK